MFLDLTDFSGKSAGNSGNLMLPLFEKSAGNLGAGNLGNHCIVYILYTVYKQENFQKFFSAFDSSRQAGENSLAEFLRFLALKKVFSNHL